MKYVMKTYQLRKVAKDTINWDSRSNTFQEIFWDTKTGEMWTVTQSGNSWTEYHNENIILVDKTSRHLSAEKIKKLALQQIEWLEKIKS